MRPSDLSTLNLDDMGNDQIIDLAEQVLEFQDQTIALADRLAQNCRDLADAIDEAAQTDDWCNTHQMFKFLCSCK